MPVSVSMLQKFADALKITLAELVAK